MKTTREIVCEIYEIMDSYAEKGEESLREDRAMLCLRKWMREQVGYNSSDKNRNKP